jgi:hypothetical protein
LQERHDFGGKRRKRREPAAEAGRHEQAPFGRETGVGREKCDRHTDDETADKVRGERPRGHRRKAAVQPERKSPTQEATEYASRCHRYDLAPHGIVDELMA